MNDDQDPLPADVLPVLEAQVEDAGPQDYVSISGSPDSVVRFLRLLINWDEELEDGEE